MEPLTAEVLGPRDVVVVEGPDAATYLQWQVAQDLRPLAIGGTAWTLVLEPAGKVVALARVGRPSEERFELDTDAGYGDALLARLARFKIRVQADLDDGARCRPMPRRRVTRRRGSSSAGRRWVTRSSRARRCPRPPGLTGVAVSFTKGCYPGQELVERMDSRGAEAPRQLRRLSVPDGARPGDPVVDDSGDVVGELTSVAGTRALGYVRARQRRRRTGRSH